MNYSNASISVAVLLATALSGRAEARGPEHPLTIRTEQYPRPPYSGATYYIYEIGGAPVCTKLAVCNKFGSCEVTYHRGSFKAEEDMETGEPYGTTLAVPISAAKRHKHVCLVRFKVGGA